MGRLFICLWLLVPVAIAAWHYGPGQPQLARDKAGDTLRKAKAAEAAQDWAAASELYAKAAAELPEGNLAEKNRLEVLQARNRIRAGEILEGQEQLEKLLATLGDDSASKALATDALHELAFASYYAAWVMRLEGATDEEWKPESETARQIFRYLAERAEKNHDGDADTYQKNLENTIRLEQMDLATLLAKTPKKKCCCNCKNLSQRKRKQNQSKCQNEGKQQKKEDQQLRQVIHKAGLGSNEGSGS